MSEVKGIKEFYDDTVSMWADDWYDNEEMLPFLLSVKDFLGNNKKVRPPVCLYKPPPCCLTSSKLKSYNLAANQSRAFQYHEDEHPSPPQPHLGHILRRYISYTKFALFCFHLFS